MNGVMLYGDIEAAVSGRGAGGWRARQVTLLVGRWVYSKREGPDHGVPFHIALRFTKLNA